MGSRFKGSQKTRLAIRPFASPTCFLVGTGKVNEKKATLNGEL